MFDSFSSSPIPLKLILNSQITNSPTYFRLYIHITHCKSSNTFNYTHTFQKSIKFKFILNRIKEPPCSSILNPNLNSFYSNIDDKILTCIFPKFKQISSSCRINFIRQHKIPNFPYLEIFVVQYLNKLAALLHLNRFQDHLQVADLEKENMFQSLEQMGFERDTQRFTCKQFGCRI